MYIKYGFSEKFFWGAFYIYIADAKFLPPPPEEQNVNKMCRSLEQFQTVQGTSEPASQPLFSPSAAIDRRAGSTEKI
jgi:hypothetical protein